MTRLVAHARRNAIAYLALFVALGGTSYAAFSLPAGSVGARQLQEPRDHGGQAEPDEHRRECEGVGESDSGPADGACRHRVATFT